MVFDYCSLRTSVFLTCTMPFFMSILMISTCPWLSRFFLSCRSDTFPLSSTILSDIFVYDFFFTDLRQTPLYLLTTEADSDSATICHEGMIRVSIEWDYRLDIIAWFCFFYCCFFFFSPGVGKVYTLRE